MDLGGMMYSGPEDGLLKDLAAITGETGTVKGSMYHLVKDEMDADGVLPPGAIERLAAFKRKVAECTERSAQIQSSIEALDEKLKRLSVPVLTARTVYPNTLIKAGAIEKNIKEKITNVRISVDQGAITVARV